MLNQETRERIALDLALDAIEAIEFTSIMEYLQDWGEGSDEACQIRAILRKRLTLGLANPDEEVSK